MIQVTYTEFSYATSHHVENPTTNKSLYGEFMIYAHYNSPCIELQTSLPVESSATASYPVENTDV